MNLITKILLSVIAILIFICGGIFLVYQDTQKELLSVQKNYSDLQNKNELARLEIENLGIQKGELENSISKWKVRAEKPTVIETETKIVYKNKTVKVPADCLNCIAKYKLNKEYENENKAIKISIIDILGEDRATWLLDMPKLCPVIPHQIDCNESFPEKGGNVRMILDSSLGYGIAGPEIAAGLYPFAIRGDRWETEFGAWGNMTLHDNGKLAGNAILGARIRRVGKW